MSCHGDIPFLSDEMSCTESMIRLTDQMKPSRYFLCSIWVDGIPLTMRSHNEKKTVNRFRILDRKKFALGCRDMSPNEDQPKRRKHRYR